MKVTELLAIYAACLSTVIFVWNVVRTVPRYKVTMIVGVNKVEGEHTAGAYVFVQNPSSQAVHISNISLMYPYKRAGIFELILHTLKYRRLPWQVGWVSSSLANYKIDDECPISIESGKSHSVFIAHEILESISEDSDRRVLKAVVQDQLWRNKYSSKFEY